MSEVNIYFFVSLMDDKSRKWLSDSLRGGGASSIGNIPFYKVLCLVGEFTQKLELLFEFGISSIQEAA